MVWSEIALICVAAVLVIVVLAWIITAARRRNKEKEREVDGVKIIDGVRYTRSSDVVDERGNVKISLNKGDHLLERGREYTVGKNGDLLAGKYTILSADENTDSINIRIGGLVREYKHFSSVVLNEGDQVSAVSNSIVLR